jgi:transcription elongation factor Elf1
LGMFSRIWKSLFGETNMAFPYIREPFYLTQADKEKIINILKKKIDREIACPMCGHPTFSIADGLFNNYLSSDPARSQSIGGPSVPTIAIVCEKCGFVSQHALGILDLLDGVGNV